MSPNRIVWQYRTQYGHTQKFAAQQIGISPQYLNDLESARRSVPWLLMSRLIDALGIPPDLLVRAKVIEELALLQSDHRKALHVVVERNDLVLQADEAGPQPFPEEAVA